MQSMNMNMNPQQLNMGMNMAAMMQGRPPSVTGNLNSPSILSPSPTTPTQVRIDRLLEIIMTPELSEEGEYSVTSYRPPSCCLVTFLESYVTNFYET